MIIETSYWVFTPIDLVVQLLYAGLSAILLLFGFDLLGRYLRADKRTRTDAAYITFLIIAMAMIGYGLNLIPTMINYFYPPRIPWVYALQQFVIVIIVVPFGMVAEQILFKKKMKVSIVTTLGIIVAVYMMIIVIVEAVDDTIISNDVRGWMFYPAWASYALFGLIGFFGFLIIMFKLLSPQKEIRHKMVWALFAGFIALFGAVIQGMIRVGAPDSNIILSGDVTLITVSGGNTNWWYVIGAIIEIIAWLIMRNIMLSIPNYSEFEWKTGMIELHVILAETGISLYYKSFHQVKPEDLKGNVKVTVNIPEDEARPNTDLVAGGLIGIKGMLGEISGDRGKLENIQIGEKSLIFKQGEVLMCLLLADKNLGVYHSTLRDLVFEIEKSHPDLKNFNGDTRMLHIGPIVEQVFGFKPKKV
jgi:hypothetical protein